MEKKYEIYEDLKSMKKDDVFTNTFSHSVYLISDWNLSLRCYPIVF